MSAISSISSSSQAQLLQQVQQRHKQGSNQDQQAAIQSALKAAGVDPSKVASIEAQLQSAVQGVVGSGSASNQQAAIQQAVDSVLQKNGVDVNKFQAAMQSGHKSGHHHKHGGTGQANATSGVSGTSQNNSTSSTSLFGSSSGIDTSA